MIIGVILASFGIIKSSFLSKSSLTPTLGKTPIQGVESVVIHPSRKGCAAHKAFVIISSQIENGNFIFKKDKFIVSLSRYKVNWVSLQ